MESPSYAGLLVLDKPSGMTSRAALDQALRWFPRRTRMGHTGTLDPLATGVLVLCLGPATRLAEYVQRMPKTYRTDLRLGARSTTDDVDGDVTAVTDAPAPTEPEVRQALTRLTGSLDQVPPAFSAAHVDGKRAYALARRGEAVDLPARQVQIYRIDLLRYAYPSLELEICCSKGTYIRSLARDMGELLGCGGLVETLRRTRVGPFSVEGALPLSASADEARASVLPIEAAVAELPRLSLSPSTAQRLRQGQTVTLDGDFLPSYTEAAVFSGDGKLVGVGLVEEGRLRPTRILA